VLNISGFDLARTMEMKPDFLEDTSNKKHDRSVSSMSIIQPGNVDLDSVQDWVSDLLKEKGNDIYRMKGVLSISNDTQKYVYQAVHMTFNGEFGDEWVAGEERESKLVFIGKNLDKEALKKSFVACLMTPALIEKKRGMLRFPIGEKVDCIGGGGWLRGEVVAQMYRDDKMPAFMIAPYQVKLEQSGKLICALLDSDEVIKRACLLEGPDLD
jgi:hypothetical protein